MTTSIESITPNLVVASIEDCLPFWIDRLGFAEITRVAHGDRIGFVILARDGVSIMLQSEASMAEDVTPLAGQRFAGMLYVKVKDLAAVRQALAGIERVVPERRTFYGADEIIVREPGGNVVAFAHLGG